MSVLYLHIGLPKTGTTAIQEFLLQNRGPLEELGWRYPSFLRQRNHLELAAYAGSDRHVLGRGFIGLKNVDDLDEFRSSLSRAIREHTAQGDWAFSSEHLASRVDRTEGVRRLSELFGHFAQVRIVMFVRPQDEMAVSSHSTWVLDGSPAPFDLAKHVGLTQRYDYRDIAERWMQVFGEGSVEIRLYDKRRLLEDVVVSLGGTSLEDWTIPSPENVSLTNVELAFLREMNGRLPRWADGAPDKRHGDFRNQIAGSGLGEPLRLRQQDRRAILDAFRDSNEWVLERALNSGDTAAFFPAATDEAVTDGPSNIDHVLSADEALEFASRLWRHAGRLKRRRALND